MGISGLLPLLKKASIQVNIKDLNGCTAAIDVYSWLHKGVYLCADNLYNGIEDNAYINYCLRKVDQLIENNIKPILVFDGKDLPKKSVTNEARRNKREKEKQRINDLLTQGKELEAKELMKRCIDITQDIANKLIYAIRERNSILLSDSSDHYNSDSGDNKSNNVEINKKIIDYIVAPYEADAQIAYLIKSNIADFAISEDSDLLLLEAKYVLTKLNSNGDGILVMFNKILDCFQSSSKHSKFNIEKFKRMCILSGCDYLPNLKGIGLAKAKRFIDNYRDDDFRRALFRLPTILNMKQLKMTSEYADLFFEAENIFKYQLIFCPLNRKLRPLNDYENECVDKNIFKYAGDYFDDKTALQLALGNIHFDTMEIIDNYQFNFDIDKVNSIWSKNFDNTLNEITNKLEILIMKSNLFSEKITNNLNKQERKRSLSANDYNRKRLKTSDLDKNSSQESECSISQDYSISSQCSVDEINNEDILIEDNLDIQDNKQNVIVKSKYFIEQSTENITLSSVIRTREMKIQQRSKLYTTNVTFDEINDEKNYNDNTQLSSSSSSLSSNVSQESLQPSSQSSISSSDSGFFLEEKGLKNKARKSTNFNDFLSKYRYQQ